MERGIILLTNLELATLYNMAVSENCQMPGLINKLHPVEGTNQAQEHSVLMSEDEAEVLLDCMPMPSEHADPNLVSARTKLSNFIAQSRFADNK